MNKQVSIFNETIMTIFENCSDNDPPWMNKQTKTLIAKKVAEAKNVKL